MNGAPRFSNTDVFNNNKKAGSYIIHMNQLIGKGNYGEVYQAHHIDQSKKNEEYACKIISRNKCKMSDLEKEANILIKAKGKYVVSLIDYSYSAKNFYYIMEITNQGTLTEYLNKNFDKLQEVDILSIFKKIVIGYKESLYNNTILHRDLKLDNILIHNGIPKISDFGHSIIRDAEDENNLSQSAVGSPLYSPPQNQGIGYDQFDAFKYTYKYDIYSLGIILYYCFYNMSPNNLKTQPELQKYLWDLKNKGSREVIKFPQGKEISQSTKEAIWQMLEFDEEKRIDIDSLLNHKMFDKLGLDFNQEEREDDDSDIGKSIQATRRNYKKDEIAMGRLSQSTQEQLFDKDKFYLFYRNFSALCMINFTNLYHYSKPFQQIFKISEPQIDVIILCLAKMQTTLLEFCYTSLYLEKQKAIKEKNGNTYFQSSMYDETFKMIQNEYNNANLQLKFLWESIETKFARIKQKGDQDKVEKEIQQISSLMRNQNITMSELLIMYKNNLKLSVAPQIKLILNNKPNQILNQDISKITHALLFVLSNDINGKNQLTFNFEQYYSSLTRGIDYNQEQIRYLIGVLSL